MFVVGQKQKQLLIVVEQFTTETRTNNFIIDVYEKSGDLNDPQLRYMLIM